MNQNVKKIRDLVTQVASDHREIHSTVSRVGKAIDKNFVNNPSCIGNETFLEQSLNTNVLNRVIVEHFLRQGMLDIAEELMRESKVEIAEEKKDPFSELNEILDALKKKNVLPALKWVNNNRTELEQQNSLLEFKLHRLQFIEYLNEGLAKQSELIQYARQNFQSLALRHEKEVQSLMGCLIYLKSGLLQSPYSHLLDPANWIDICDVFTRDACALLGMSYESPLSVAFNSGCVALPALLNLRQVKLQSQEHTVWSTKDELPILIELGKQCQFHSIFACPILRQQSTENNPPMRLVCGHVISRDALSKLTNGNKLKCPYCPLEQSPQDARQINF